jgi:hypothetical protein
MLVRRAGHARAVSTRNICENLSLNFAIAARHCWMVFRETWAGTDSYGHRPAGELPQGQLKKRMSR